MIIRFSKSGGVPVITCVRHDGSVTYSKSAHGAFFGPHDLMHYAVESTLRLRDSFFGLIAKGKSIEWFAQPGIAQKLPAEAVHTEMMVNQLMAEISSGVVSSADEFNETLRLSLSQSKISSEEKPRFISDEVLLQIRERFVVLMSEWRQIGEDGTIEVQFD